MRYSNREMKIQVFKVNRDVEQMKKDGEARRSKLGMVERRREERKKRREEEGRRNGSNL
jgi:hypothetical protein